MSKGQQLLIFGSILIALVPLWYGNRWLQRIVQPRRSLVRLLVYILLAFALVFGFTFLLSSAIFQLFPPRR